MRKPASTPRLHRLRRVAVALAAAACVMPAAASVVMNGTRFVYREGDREITVKVSNVGKIPALTQAWIDDGDAKATPETVDVPFNLTPPIARLETGKSQTLRLAYTGGELPGDRESQFWINVLEVPPKADDAGEDAGQMQLAFRYRLKLFYRPKALRGSSDDAANGITWQATPGGLTAGNDSAYHVTVNHLKVSVDGKEIEAEPFAVGPRSSHPVALEATTKAGSRIDVEFQTINDYGGFVTHKTSIGR